MSGKVTHTPATVRLVSPGTTVRQVGAQYVVLTLFSVIVRGNIII